MLSIYPRSFRRSQFFRYCALGPQILFENNRYVTYDYCIPNEISQIALGYSHRFSSSYHSYFTKLCVYAPWPAIVYHYHGHNININSVLLKRLVDFLPDTRVIIYKSCITIDMMYECAEKLKFWPFKPMPY